MMRQNFKSVEIILIEIDVSNKQKKSLHQPEQIKNSLQINVKLIILILIAMDHISNMNYYFDYFRYYMMPPPVYPFQAPFPLSYLEKSTEKPKPESKEDSTPNLKIQEQQPSILQAKQEPKGPTIETTRRRRSENKKTESDSFTEKRNIIPNNINHILAFLQRKSKSEKYVKMLIKKNGGLDSYTPKRFYCYQKQLKEKLHVHVNKQSLDKLINHLDQCSQIFPLEEQKFYNSISRILIYFYLRQIAKITILSSGRVKQTNKKDHLIAQRQLLSHVTGRDYSS